MNGRFRSVGAVMREALSSAWSQPVQSILTFAMVAGMCVSVILTAGRTVGAQERVAATLESPAGRTIVVRAAADAGVTSAILERLRYVRGITWAGAFGPAIDVTNSNIPDGNPVPLRTSWGLETSQSGAPFAAGGDSLAWGSVDALEALGMNDHSGTATSAAGTSYSIQGELVTPTYLSDIQPLLVTPQSSRSSGTVAVVVVVAKSPALVKSLIPVVMGLTDASDRSKIKIETSQALESVRSSVNHQLSAFGRGLTLIIFGATGALLAAVLCGLVLLRRRDFGRRRALGASRSLVVSLVLTQTLFVALLASIVGTAAAAATLLLTGDPLPSLTYSIAVAVAATVATIVAAVPPSFLAANRDPIKELRVP